MIRPSTLEKAIDCMRRGSRLVQSHHPRYGTQFHLMPEGRAVSNELAMAIMTHQEVISGRDGLFTGTPQTWRARQLVEPVERHNRSEEE
jgi:hypothetical protein